MKPARVRIIAILFSVTALVTAAAGCGGAEGEGTLTVRDSRIFGRDVMSYGTESSLHVKIQIGQCRAREGNLSDDYEATSMHRHFVATGDGDADRRGRASWIRQREKERKEQSQRCQGAYDVILTFPSKLMSINTAIFNVKCVNLDDRGLFRCTGDDNGLHDDRLGPVKYVTLIRDTKVIGFQAWQANPPEDSGRAQPYLLAHFGQHRGFVPR